jgi:uncharacterized membrane protein/protein-disulfide isomerase
MKKTTQFPAFSVAFLAACGLIISFLLLHEHYHGQTYRAEGGGSLVSAFSGFACGDQSSYFNCEEVDSSPYARLLGFPLAAWGMLYFIVLGVIALFWAFSGEVRGGLFMVLAFWLALFGAVFDGVLFMISLWIINAVCPLCALSYLPTVISLVLITVFIVRGRGLSVVYRVPMQAAKNHRHQCFRVSLAFAVTVFMAAAAAVAADYGLQHARSGSVLPGVRAASGNRVTEKADAFFSEPWVALDDSGSWMAGVPGAPVVITVFSDFLCPHCALTAAVLGEVAGSYRGRVGLIFMNYPLEMACNAHVSRDVHSGSCLAARAALCAGRQGLFTNFHDELFARKLARIDEETVHELAAKAGLAMSEFDQCLRDPGMAAELEGQIALAARIGVSATPAVFINENSIGSVSTKKFWEYY